MFMFAIAGLRRALAISRRDAGGGKQSSRESSWPDLPEDRLPLISDTKARADRSLSVGAREREQEITQKVTFFCGFVRP